jgi:hypothetical protein
MEPAYTSAETKARVGERRKMNWLKMQISIWVQNFQLVHEWDIALWMPSLSGNGSWTKSQIGSELFELWPSIKEPTPNG